MMSNAPKYFGILVTTLKILRDYLDDLSGPTKLFLDLDPVQFLDPSAKSFSSHVRPRPSTNLSTIANLLISFQGWNLPFLGEDSSTAATYSVRCGCSSRNLRPNEGSEDSR